MKIIAHQDQQREEWRPGVETRMHVSARNGAAQICIFEQWLQPAAQAPTHVHPVEEILTVISGEAEMWVDQDHMIVTAGQSLIVPDRRRHGFRNIGSNVLHVQAVLASSIFEATFEGSANTVRRWQPASANSD